MICTKCQKEYPEEYFYIEHTKYGDIRRHVCKFCIQKRKKELRNLNKEKVKEWSKTAITNKRNFINSFKTPCIICGENDISCIDFHHLNPKDKEFQIGNFNKSKNKLKIEIQKCICLCSNCHRKLHSGKINLENHFNKVKVESVTD